MDAILLAGGIPEPDSPLYSLTQGKPKAALPIGKKVMIQWVLDALEDSPSVEGIAIIGAEELKGNLPSRKVFNHLEAGDGLIENFQRGADAVLARDPTAKCVAVVSSDIPLITPEAVEWILNSTLDSDLDVYYSIIEQEQMEERFPESGRTFVNLRGRKVCGGDLSVINLSLYHTRREFWRKIVEARKSYLRQAALVGFDILLLLLLRRLSLDNAVSKVTRRLGISGTALICPYPEIGMDIDKPHQLEIARQELT